MKQLRKEKRNKKLSTIYGKLFLKITFVENLGFYVLKNLREFSDNCEIEENLRIECRCGLLILMSER